MRAVVVGAGFAGLIAAHELVRAGADVQVLEARTRVGGRVLSRELDGGAVVEMGAEFILPGNTVIREVAQELGLGLWDKGIRYGRREPRGGPPVSEEALETAVATLERRLGGGGALAGESLASALERVEIDAGARAYILARAEISAATPADSIPATDLLGLAHIGDEPSPGVAGGNQRIALELARRLGDRVILDAPVHRVSWSASGGAVVAARETAVDADAVVVAVPARVLGAIEFEPALPGGQADALAAVRYGHAAKLFVPLAEPPVPRAVLSVPERYWCWTATGEGRRPQRVVSAFAGSPGALEGLAVGEGPQRWLGSLRQLRPELDLDYGAERAVLSTWSDDEWVRAAYSVSPGAEATEAMRAPCGPIHFAGEHTAGEFSALMEGALRSGRLAAHQVLGAAA